MSSTKESYPRPHGLTVAPYGILYPYASTQFERTDMGTARDSILQILNTLGYESGKCQASSTTLF